jgi:LCP family protein required for cell wall assembly
VTLVLGSDSRGPHTTARADSIVMMRTDPGKHLISMLSIPRDLRVPIPGHGPNKINAAYAYGGAPLLIRTINRLVDPVQVNHIVLVNFAGFKELIDSLGGVTLYNKRAIKSSQPFDGHNWFFKQGTIHLDGRHALAYSRIRHTTNPADTDISRTERQQLVMQALSRQLVSFSTFLHLPSVGAALGKPLTTDLSANELIGMGWDKFRASRTLECHMGGTPQTIGGQDVLLSVPENRNVIQEFLGASAPLPPAKGQLYAPGCYIK